MPSSVSWLVHWMRHSSCLRMTRQPTKTPPRSQSDLWTPERSANDVAFHFVAQNVLRTSRSCHASANNASQESFLPIGCCRAHLQQPHHLRTDRGLPVTPYLGQRICFHEQETMEIKSRIRGSLGDLPQISTRTDIKKVLVEISFAPLRCHSFSYSLLCSRNMVSEPGTRKDDSIDSAKDAATHHSDEKKIQKN